MGQGAKISGESVVHRSSSAVGNSAAARRYLCRPRKSAEGLHHLSLRIGPEPGEPGCMGWLAEFTASVKPGSRSIASDSLDAGVCASSYRTGPGLLANACVDSVGDRTECGSSKNFCSIVADLQRPERKRANWRADQVWMGIVECR